MIPEIVAEIATLLRNEYYEQNDKAFEHSINVAWQIYNMVKNNDSE